MLDMYDLNFGSQVTHLGNILDPGFGDNIHMECNILHKLVVLLVKTSGATTNWQKSRGVQGVS